MIKLKTLLSIYLCEDDVMDKTIKNPETGRDIKVSSALSYDKDSQAYQKAKSIVGNVEESDDGDVDKIKEKIESLKGEYKTASDNFDFDKAGQIFKQIQSLNTKLSEKSTEPKKSIDPPQHKKTNIPKTKVFKDSKHAETYYNKDKIEFKKQIDEHDKKTLNSYLDDSTDINSYLRLSKKSKKHSSVKNDIAKLDNMFSNKSFKTKDNLNVLRTISLQGDQQNFFDSLEVGDVYEDKGYCSTTLSPKTFNFIDFAYKQAGKTLKMNIIVKKGSNVVLVDAAVDDNDAQSEVLLNRNSKYKLISKDNNQLTVELL